MMDPTLRELLESPRFSQNEQDEGDYRVIMLYISLVNPADTSRFTVDKLKAFLEQYGAVEEVKLLRRKRGESIKASVKFMDDSSANTTKQKIDRIFSEFLNANIRAFFPADESQSSKTDTNIGYSMDNITKEIKEAKEDFLIARVKNTDGLFRNKTEDPNNLGNLLDSTKKEIRKDFKAKKSKFGLSSNLGIDDLDELIDGLDESESESESSDSEKITSNALVPPIYQSPQHFLQAPQAHPYSQSYHQYPKFIQIKEKLSPYCIRHLNNPMQSKECLECISLQNYRRGNQSASEKHLDALSTLSLNSYNSTGYAYSYHSMCNYGRPELALNSQSWINPYVSPAPAYDPRFVQNKQGIGSVRSSSNYLGVYQNHQKSAYLDSGGISSNSRESSSHGALSKVDIEKYREKLDPNATKVIQVKGLSNKELTPHIIYKLFGNFGNVVKLVLQKKRQTALIEYESPELATIAKEMLNNLSFFGNPMKIAFSTLESLDKMKIDKSTELYIGNPRTFRFRESKKISINPPSRVLHLSNIAREIYSEEKIAEVFKSKVTVIKVKLLNHEKDEKCMALVELDSLENSLAVISTMHNSQFFNRSLKLSFTRSRA